MNDFKVDAIGVGSPKCGTEWIVACLREHPQLNFSKHKEPNFFLSPRGGLDALFYEEIKIHSWDEYVKDFDTNKNSNLNLNPNENKNSNSNTKTESKNKLNIEFSIKYIFDKEALKKIKETFPNVKLIIGIREPADFLYSNYTYIKNSNFYDLVPSTFEQALENAVDGDPFYKEYARFNIHIKNVLELFDKNNVFIFTLDEIKKDHQKVIKDIFKFLNIDQNFEPSMLNKRINTTTMIRNPVFMKLANIALKTLSKLRLNRLINYLMNTDTVFRKAFRYVAFSSKKNPPMNQNTKNKLKKEFKNDILELEQIINKDLSAWI